MKLFVNKNSMYRVAVEQLLKTHELYNNQINKRS